MPKQKEYFKITANCDSSTYYAIAIADESKLENLKRRCMKSLMDFVDINREDYMVYVKVEPTKELPEEGTDLVLKPKRKHVEEDDLVEEESSDEEE